MVLLGAVFHIKISFGNWKHPKRFQSPNRLSDNIWKG